MEENIQENSEQISFEEALKKLQDVITRLEDDSIALEESVKLYEEGVKLSAFCTDILSKAELKIEQVNENSK